MVLFRKVWAIYAVFFFLLTMLLSIPYVILMMVFFPGQKALRKNIYFLHHIFTPTFLFFAGIRLKVIGKEKIIKNTSYVIVSNHSSSLDFIVNAAAYPGVFRFLAKQELLKIPIFGWIVKKMCLIVDRRSAMSRARSMVELKKELAEGMSIFIYPEGGRNQSEDLLGTFYDGAFRIAIQTGAPLMVQTIVNMKDISATAKSVDLSPGVVKIVWEGPFLTKKGDNVNELKQKVRDIMLEKLSTVY
jgi:1-acyl-sn-glycerol-3-phosphate acyltransferase